MKVIGDNVPSSRYRAFMNQHLTIQDVKEGFRHATVLAYQNREAVWHQLRNLFCNSNVLQSSIRANKGILVKGVEITSSIMCEALEYFCRAFYNFLAQDKLIEHGYSTWSEITNYYASFFSIHSLLRLQGRCITRIWRPGRRQFYIFPNSFKDHEYVVCVEGKPTHDAAWDRYYEIYDGFSYDINIEFETIYKKKYVGRPDEEIDFRNQRNYEPYQGYEEIRDPELIQKMIRKYEDKKFAECEIHLLSSLTTDPDYRYYARSALRLIFSYTLLRDVASENSRLNALLGSRRSAMQHFLSQVGPRKEDEALTRRLSATMKL